MSGEGRCARDGCSARLYGRDGYCSMSCEDLHRTERERDEALSCLDEAQAEILRLKIRHTYMTVERDWYREACEEWLRHSHGCAADVGDEYKCKCGLRKWLAEDRKRRETVYKDDR